MVGLRNKATLGTGLRGMLWVNQLNEDASNPSLVGDKLAELVECPRLVSTPLAMSNNRPLPDSLQTFKSDTSVSVFSLRYKPFADHVIYGTSESRLSPFQFLKMTLCRFCSFALQRCFKGFRLFSNLIYHFPRIKLTVRINSKVNNTQVDTNNTSRVIRRGFRRINSYGQIKCAFPQDKVSLLDNTSYSRFLVSPKSDRDNLSAFECENRDPVKSLPGKNTLVINYSRMGFEGNQFRLISTVCFSNCPNSPYCHLSRQSKIFAEFLVGKMVKFYLSILPELVAHPVATIKMAPLGLQLFRHRRLPLKPTRIKGKEDLSRIIQKFKEVRSNS